MEGENLDADSDINTGRQRQRRLSQAQPVEADPVLPPVIVDGLASQQDHNNGIKSSSSIMQELQKEVASLREELSVVGDLRAELAVLRARVARLEPGAAAVAVEESE